MEWKSSTTFRKTQVKIGRIHQKNKFFLYKIYFSEQTFSESDRSCDDISCEQSHFGNIKFSLSYTQKCMKKKWQKNRLYEKRYSFEIMKGFYSKFWYDNSKPGSTLCQNFKFVSFELTEITRQRAVRPGRAGPGRFIKNIDYMFKNKHFLFHKHYQNIILKKLMKTSFWSVVHASVIINLHAYVFFFRSYFTFHLTVAVTVIIYTY